MVDREVRARFRAGEPEAVAAVYREYGRLVFAVAHRVLNDRGLAEEATQQTFVKAWRAADRLDDEREMTPWLASICRRVAIDIQRREALRTAAPLEAVPESDPALISAAASVEDMHNVWEVRAAVSHLPADEREVVRLQHFEGMTQAQMAERLGVAVGTVKSRSFRAHQRLAAALGHLQE
jgi:RNA polymerase sigma factor (sigma-70 family)